MSKRSLNSAPRPITKVLQGTIAHRLGTLSIEEATQRTHGFTYRSPVVVRVVAEIATRDPATNPLTREELAWLTGANKTAANMAALMLITTGVAEEGMARVKGLSRPVYTLVPSEGFAAEVAQNQDWQEAIAAKQQA